MTFMTFHIMWRVVTIRSSLRQIRLGLPRTRRPKPLHLSPFSPRMLYAEYVPHRTA